MQIIFILKIFKDFFACKNVLDANHHYPENIQMFFRLQNCLRRKSSLSQKYSKTFSPARLSWPQIIIILKIFKIFSRLQNCLSRKSSLSWKYSKTFSHAKMPYLQIIFILKIFKDFFACKSVLAQNHQYLGNIQRLFRLQKCLGEKSSLSRKNSKTFSPAKLS